MTLLPGSVTSLCLLCISLAISFILAQCIYNIAFHPLRRFPGPKLRAASRVPYALTKFRGRRTTSAKALHDQYGPVVRLAPDVLSFITSQAWIDVYGPKLSDRRGDVPKDPSVYRRIPGRPASITSANDEDHRRLRRIQAPAFSERAIAMQEKYIQQHISIFLHKIQDLSHDPNTSNNGAIDVAHWITLLITDIIGELAFGQDFGCLRDGALHPWLGTISSSVRMVTIMSEVTRLPTWLVTIVRAVAVPGNLKRERGKLHEFGAQAVKRRMAMGTDRPDLMSYALKHRDEGGMSDGEIGEAALTFIVAGSETTASLLSGALFLLTENPATLQKLTGIVRGGFASPSDLTLLKLQGHEYLGAVLHECLRLYPPAPDGFMRRTDERGAIVAGEIIPPHTSMSVSLYAATRSESNFHRAGEFLPERWLKDCPPEFAGDDRAVAKPFSYGPRDCLGKTLAWAEMRLILANIIWHFDLETFPENKEWQNKQRAYFVWERQPLKLMLTPRNWQ
ncbi:isotrichodermin C-15 hydroxylase [Xylariaceae sp. FL0016]|nr:isotrichodermin C-15 hydroxylase [Xylariaceae sp. FL0016]